MSINGNSIEYPNENVKAVLEKAVEEMGYEDFDIELKMASSKGDNYLGVIYRAVVRGIKDGARSKINLIIKSAPTYNRSKIFIDVYYKREIYCYQVALPIMLAYQDESEIPEAEKFSCLKVISSNLKHMEETIIMEDLMEHGYTMCDRQKSLDIDHVRLVIKNLARFHALSFKLKQKDPEMFEKIVGSIHQGVENTDIYKEFIIVSIDRAVDILEGVYKDKLVEFGKDSFEKFKEYTMPELAGEYAILCHGDCWTNNIMFKYEEEKPVALQLLDWQMAKCSSPVLDIAYHLFSSTDEYLRQEHYYELLDLYYDTLKVHLAKMDCDVNTCFPKSVYKKHLEVFMPFGLIMGCVLAPLFMSEEEDIPDMNEILKKDVVEQIEMKNSKSQRKYEDRVRGIMKDMLDFNII